MNSNGIKSSEKLSVEEKLEEEPVEKLEEEPVEKKRKKKNKCEHCMSKLGLFTFTCKCSMVLCQKHLSPHNHSCTFDYVKEKKDLIEKNNPKLGEKLIRI